MEGEDNKKKSMGRKKIEMKRIDKKEDRTSTFSKRKSGIQKKAAEISTLCGADVGFMAVSPSGNPTIFNTSTTDGGLIQRFMKQVTAPPPPENVETAASSERVETLKRECDALEKILETEMELSRALKKITNGLPTVRKDNASWFDLPLDDLTMDELAAVRRFAEENHRKISDHLDMDERVESAANASSSGRCSDGNMPRRGNWRSRRNPN